MIKQRHNPKENKNSSKQKTENSISDGIVSDTFNFDVDFGFSLLPRFSPLP